MRWARQKTIPSCSIGVKRSHCLVAFVEAVFLEHERKRLARVGPLMEVRWDHLTIWDQDLGWRAGLWAPVG